MTLMLLPGPYNESVGNITCVVNRESIIFLYEM